MLDRSGEATRVVEILRLAPHPEGGHSRETYRAPAPAGPRSAMSLIYYLLAAGVADAGNRREASAPGLSSPAPYRPLSCSTVLKWRPWASNRRRSRRIEPDSALWSFGNPSGSTILSRLPERTVLAILKERSVRSSAWRRSRECARY